MEKRNPEEIRFAKLAEKLGESLESVWNMVEAERSQLLTLLLIDEQDGEVNGNIVEEVENNSIKTTDEQETNTKLDFDEHSSNVSSSTEERNVIYKELQLDTDRVKRLLVGSPHENMEDALILAYLEAHLKDPDRVKVVVEELLGVNREVDSVFPQEMSEESFDLEKGKGKGKGLSKSSSLAICTSGIGSVKRQLIDTEDESEDKSQTKQCRKFHFKKRSVNTGNILDLKAEYSNSNDKNVKDEKVVNLEVDMEVVEIPDVEITSSDDPESVPDILVPDKKEATEGDLIDSHDTK